MSIVAIFFDEAYEEQFGYPMPGIVFGAVLKLYL